MKKKPVILFSALNWGLGHSSRTTPVIKAFLQQGCDVLIAGYGNAGSFLQKEFPQLEYIHLPGINITYPKKGSMSLKMVLSAFSILTSIRKEHKALERIITEKNIDIVFSDNRYGLWSKKIPSIFMTHQVFIQTPKRLNFLRPIINNINHHYIKHFTECWIPDFEGNDNLSGDLSHNKDIPFPHYYINPLTRFNKKTTTKSGTILIIISGPEPQRTIFEEKILCDISSVNEKIIVVKGKADEEYSKTIINSATIISHPSSQDMEEMLNSCSFVISRPGYSTLMDLVTLEKPAILIATPGQTEQELLSEIHHGKQFYSIKQSDFTLKKAIEKGKQLTCSPKYNTNNNLLSNNIIRLLDKEINKDTNSSI